ncbi:hypothetical protein [Thaumasiovibrio sp. DFM-14]|uniref:hypothetical protein n=1 Tax=Thaumasiovibrio sp. DFM-14 TaxID=3384792 RepID=UPI00399F9F4E
MDAPKQRISANQRDALFTLVVVEQRAPQRLPMLDRDLLALINRSRNTEVATCNFRQGCITLARTGYLRIANYNNTSRILIALTDKGRELGLREIARRTELLSQ